MAASEELPSHTRLIVTGGGYVTLEYPKSWLADTEIRRLEFLEELHAWTLSELAQVIDLLAKPGRDIVMGVDVSVNRPGNGQFALYVGQENVALVPKRFPVDNEDHYLAGVGAVRAFPYPRVVETRIGPTLILVCHDAQAFNHRNRGTVARAAQPTNRSRAIPELDQARATPGLTWALNLVHWIDSPSNTKTFRTSYGQLRADFPGQVKVAGGFGYGDIPVASVHELLGRMTAPRDMLLTKVVIDT